MELRNMLAITGCILAIGGGKTYGEESTEANKEQLQFCVEIPTLIVNEKEKILTVLKICREREQVFLGLGDNPSEDIVNKRTNKMMNCLPQRIRVFSKIQEISPDKIRETLDKLSLEIGNRARICLGEKDI